ncbi:MAG: serine--tRNA ligase, partial [Parcubacteria group bacterium]|nr:serine--tRNA ligase [Parcubacteria group bacterium]
MLDIKFIEKNAEIVKQAAKNKNADSKSVDEALQLNKERKELLTRIESLRSEKNKLDKDRADEGRKIKEELKGLEPKLKEIDDALFYVLRKIPNIPHESVPVGKDETENKVIRKWGEPKKFDFTPKDHIALGEALGVIDIETAGKVSGARFNYLKGDLAVMEIAIVQYVFSLLTNQEIVEKIARRISPMHPITPFVPVIPPVMIKPDIYIKMARLDPGQEEERFHLPKDNLYLIGSAEHTLGPMHLDEIIEENKLPLRYVGFSSCFRREAGSYGKDVRGILRVHQFDKIEMESFTASEIALNEQDFFVAIQEYMFQEFQLPYRVVMICTGDMGGP